MYKGGKLSNGKLYVKAGELWISLEALVAFEKEYKLYGPYTV